MSEYKALALQTIGSAIRAARKAGDTKKADELANAYFYVLNTKNPYMP